MKQHRTATPHSHPQIARTHSLTHSFTLAVHGPFPASPFGPPRVSESEFVHGSCEVEALSSFSLFSFSLSDPSTASMASEFKEHGVVPDVIDTWPPNVVKVEYSSAHHVNLGNVLGVKDTQGQPRLFFPTVPQAFYTVMCVDPDALSRATHEFRNFAHWVTVNVPGTGSDHVDLHKGHTVTPYMGPAPPPKSGLHRYVFLVYKQQGQIDTHNLKGFGNGKDSSEERKSFLPETWFKTHFAGQLPELYAGNFFQAGELPA